MDSIFKNNACYIIIIKKKILNYGQMLLNSGQNDIFQNDKKE